jgi:hypothetical protein
MWRLVILWQLDRMTWPWRSAGSLTCGPGVSMIRLRSNRETDTFLESLHAAPL